MYVQYVTLSCGTKTNPINGGGDKDGYNSGSDLGDNDKHHFEDDTAL